MKPFAVLLCTLFLVTSLTACGWVTITDGPAPSASNSAAPDNDVTEEEPQPSSDVVVTAEDVQSAVEALVPDEYRGQSYSCDILTASDGSGFIVSLQIDVDTEDAADIISGIFLSTPSARRATAKTETKSLFSNKLYNILHEFRRALIYNGSKSYPNHAK